MKHTNKVLHKRPLGITIVVVLADIGALFRLIGSIVVIVAAFATASRIPAGIRAVLVGLSIFSGTIAVGVLFVGHFLWRGANWARITFMVVLLAGSALTVVGMFLSDLDAESVISIVVALVCLGILNSASAKAYCPPAGVQGQSARIVVAGILNVAYGTLGYLVLAFPTLVAWTVVASQSYRAAAFYFRLRLVGPNHTIHTPLVWLLPMGIAAVMTACWLLCICFVISGIGILLMKEWARRTACFAAGAIVVGALVFLAILISTEVVDFHLLGGKLGLANTAVLTAIVVLSLTWPLTVDFLMSTERIKDQFVRSMASEEAGEPRGPEHMQALAQVRRKERKELLWVCSGVIAFLVAVALLAAALPGVRWRTAPHKRVPPSLKGPTALMRRGRHEEAIPLFLNALKSDDFLTRQAATDALVEIGEPALPALGDVLAKGDKDISSRVEMVLSRMGATAVSAYVKALKSKNKNIRYMAVHRFAQMGVEGIPGLHEALKCSDQNVRYHAVEALSKTGAPAVPALKEAVENSDSYVRSRAIAALWQIAAYDMAAVEALGEALVDQSGKSLLHYAAEAGNTDAIEKLIGEGADLNTKDASGNTPLFVVFEKMMRPTGRRGGNYARYDEAVELLIAKGADVNARDKFGRTLLERARALGRGDMARLLVAGGAKTHFDRRIYFKLPLEGVRFHWKFFDRAAYLSGHLILRIWGKDESPVEITVFKGGKLTGEWHIIGEGPRTVASGGAYFGFVSSERHPTAKGDDVEIELHVAEDLRGGWGSADQGVLPRGTHKAKGKIYMVSSEPRTLTTEKRQTQTSGWTAYLKWDTAWELLRGQASGGGGSASAGFMFGEPTNLGPTFNSRGLDEPSISADGLELYFRSNRSGGSGNYDLWVTTRATKDDPWNEPANLGPMVNTSRREHAPNMSFDGLTLFFTSDRTGGYGKADLWMTTRPTTNDMWTEPVNLGPTVNSSDDDISPCVSSDGLSLYFNSRRPGGSGDHDLWVTTRATKDDPWNEPANLGPMVNAPTSDNRPYISADGLWLFFVSRSRPGGFGQNDIWVTRRETKNDDWGTPANLGPPVNSPYSEADLRISADGSTFYFASDRSGGRGNFHMWQVSIEPVVDLMGASEATERAIARTKDRISLPPKQTVHFQVPTLLSPVEGAELDNGRTDYLDTIVWDFDWSDVAGSTEYHLYVTGERARNPVINRQGLTHSSYHHVSTRSYVTNHHRFGWTWKVRAKTEGQWGEWSPARSFHVELANTDPPWPTEARPKIPEQMPSRTIAPRRAEPEQQPSLVGKTAPPFTLEDLNGKRVSLLDFKGKVVLLDFWGTWCGPCRRVIPHLEALHKKYKDQGLVVIGMNRETDHNKVKAYADEHISYVVLLDADKEFAEYGIRGIPAAFYIGRSGTIRYREVGYGPGAEMEVERKIKELLAGKEDEVAVPKSPLKELLAADGEWKPPEKPDPQKILREAQADARAHRYEDALAKHVWFHENALKYRPSLNGVRSSFALSYWSRLGKMYPPALVKLKEIRNEAEEDVKNGKYIRESFRDLRAINRTVGEESRTKDIFILLDAQNADAAKRVFHYAQPALIKAKEYKLCGKYIDPERSFPRIIKRFRLDKRLAKDQRFGADHLDFANKKFTNDTTTLVALLVVNGRKAEAEEIAGDAKKEWDNASFHAEIDKALQGGVPKPWP